MFARLCSRLSTWWSILKYCVSFWSMSTQLFLRLTSASTARNRAVLEHVRTSSLHILVGKENWQWSWLVAGILLGLDSLQRKQLKCFCMSILLLSKRGTVTVSDFLIACTQSPGQNHGLLHNILLSFHYHSICYPLVIKLGNGNPHLQVVFPQLLQC